MDAHRNPMEQRMFVATNRFRVIPEETRAFEAAWLERETYLHELEGFLRFHLLRGPAADDHVLYTSWTLWASRAHFEAWTRSEQFRKAHAGAGSSKPLTRGHPQFEGFEVLQTITAPGDALI
jgi:heme-degrading monooxygenase HmoA